MRKKRLPVFIACMYMLYFQKAVAQGAKPSVDSIIDISASYFTKIENKYCGPEDRVARHTSKYLQKLFNREKKMPRKLAKIDSAGARQLFANSERQYAQLTDKIKSEDEQKVRGVNGTCLTMLDSIKTSLLFLDQNTSLLSQSKDIQDKVKGSITQVNQLQSKLQQTDIG